MSASVDSTPTAAEHSDAVFKTFVEAALLIALSLAQLAVGLPTGILLTLAAILLVLSLVGDAYLFGSVGRGFAVRRTLDFKASPIFLAAAILFLVLPVENEGDKIVRFALAAGLGGMVTGLLNLPRGGRRALEGPRGED